MNMKGADIRHYVCKMKRLLVRSTCYMKINEELHELNELIESIHVAVPSLRRAFSCGGAQITLLRARAGTWRITADRRTTARLKRSSTRMRSISSSQLSNRRCRHVQHLKRGAGHHGR